MKRVRSGWQVYGISANFAHPSPTAILLAVRSGVGGPQISVGFQGTGWRFLIKVPRKSCTHRLMYFFGLPT